MRNYSPSSMQWEAGDVTNFKDKQKQSANTEKSEPGLTPPSNTKHCRNHQVLFSLGRLR